MRCPSKVHLLSQNNHGIQMTKLQIQAHGSFTPGPPLPCVRREWPTNDRIPLTLVRTGIAIRINPDGHLEELISDLSGISLHRGLAGSEQETPRTSRRPRGPWKPSS